MSQNRLILDGMDDLKTALRKLPVEMRDEAAEVIDHTAEITASSLRQSYPRGDTGNLRAGVKVSHERSTFGASATVKSTSPHAHLFEFGTQNRTTRQGWRRGKSPEHKADGLVPIAQRNRKRMNQQLIDIVRKAGFDVTGTP